MLQIDSHRKGRVMNLKRMGWAGVALLVFGFARPVTVGAETGEGIEDAGASTGGGETVDDGSPVADDGAQLGGAEGTEGAVEAGEGVAENAEDAISEDPGGLTEGTDSDDEGSSSEDEGTPPDQSLNERAKDIFYHVLSNEERSYFNLHQDEGDFELIYAGFHQPSLQFTGYHESTTALLNNAIARAKTGFVDYVRLSLFMVFLHGDKPASSSGSASVLFYEPQGTDTVAKSVPATLSGNLLTIGDYRYRLSGNQVIGVQAGSQPEVTFTPSGVFDLPPTIDRVFPGQLAMRPAA
jgi:hypothetical protein